MSEQPTDQPTEQAAAFPESRVRRLYPAWEDQKRIQETWSSWPAERQTEFAKMVESGHDAELPRQIDAFLTNDDAPAEDQPGDDGKDDEGPDAEIEEALATVDTAEAYARANPDRIGDLLQAERDRPKPRKTLVEELERLQRAHQRENEE